MRVHSAVPTRGISKKISDVVFLKTKVAKIFHNSSFRPKFPRKFHNTVNTDLPGTVCQITKNFKQRLNFNTLLVQHCVLILLDETL